jgi:hypothetical protein
VSAFGCLVVDVSISSPFYAESENETIGEDDAAKRDHAFLANGFADDGKCLLANFAIRGDVIRAH